MNSWAEPSLSRKLCEEMEQKVFPWQGPGTFLLSQSQITAVETTVLPPLTELQSLRPRDKTTRNDGTIAKEKRAMRTDRTHG